MALIQERMRKLSNMAASVLAELSGVPGTRLSLAFRGIRDLDNSQIILISNTLREAEDLAEAVAPIPVSFQNAKIIRTILDQKKAGDLKIGKKLNN